MIKNSFKPYLVIAIALLVIISFPKKAQNALRNNFIRPLIPIANLFPIKNSKAHPSLQHYSPQNRIPEASSPYSTVARIIYRNPNSWNSSLWINLGSFHNTEKIRVALNSPVLYQNHLIGVVDYVGKKQSRVKLITNANLTVSVRALRGKNQYYDLLNHMQALSNYQCVQQDTVLLTHLNNLKSQVLQLPDCLYFAKGEIFGISQPIWRADSKILIGRGFNCNIEDELSIARELLSGEPLKTKGERAALIQPDDLLITTGFDGIFPAGLIVAKVLQVAPLNEGDYYYSIKASPLLTNFDSLSYVEVIQPSEFQQENP